MIKRIRFSTGDRDAGSDPGTAWRETAATGLAAPPGTRPVRVAVCVALPELTPRPKHAGLAVEWFHDTDHVARYEAWRASQEPGESEVVVVAQEHVVRGGDWLERRWHDGGAVLEHIAFATRAEELTAPEFLRRWRAHAGTVGGTPIPEQARGRAYVQNHPVPRADGDWPYDAVSEVWFDDLDDLRARVDWFAEAGRARADRDLFGDSWFVAARQEVLTDR